MRGSHHQHVVEVIHGGVRAANLRRNGVLSHCNWGSRCQQRALKIREIVIDANHPHVARALRVVHSRNIGVLVGRARETGDTLCD